MLRSPALWLDDQSWGINTSVLVPPFFFGGHPLKTEPKLSWLPRHVPRARTPEPVPGSRAAMRLAMQNPAFNPAGWKEYLSLSVNSFYSLKFGGPTDALCMSLVAAGAVCTSPWIAQLAMNVPGMIGCLGMSALGAAGLSWRALEVWRRAPVLASTLKLRSAASPYRPRPGEPMDGLLMGYTTDQGDPIYVDYEHLTRHLYISGASGVGKTVAASTLMFQHVQRGGGLAFIDGKLDVENIRQITQFAKFCGREHDVLIINPDDPDNSNTYNPVLFGDPDEKADALLNLIPSTESNAGADHYKQEAKQSLTTLIAALQRAHLAYNMIDLTVLLMSAKALEELERRLYLQAPNSEELKNYSLFLDKFRAAGNDKVAQGTIQVDKLKQTFGGIGGRLYTFGTGRFGQVMNSYEPDVVLYDAIRENKIVYVALPTMHKDLSARNFGRMFIADARTAIGRIQKLPSRERPWPPFWFFCDEAGSYVTDSFSRILEQSRSANVFWCLATQTNANFRAISDELYEMVVGNSWTKIIFKVGTHATALEAADLIGMKMGVLKSLTEAQSMGKSSAFLSPSPEYGISDGASINSAQRQQETYIVSPDDLKRLDKGECVMVFGGKDVYNLRVSRLTFTPEAVKMLGPPKVNRFRSEGVKVDGVRWRGSNFFRDVDKFLTKSAMAAAEESALREDARAAAAHKAKVGQLQANTLERRGAGDGS